MFRMMCFLFLDGEHITPYISYHNYSGEERGIFTEKLYKFMSKMPKMNLRPKSPLDSPAGGLTIPCFGYKINPNDFKGGTTVDAGSSGNIPGRSRQRLWGRS